MRSCDHCGDHVDRLHPIPPDVITRELLATFRDTDDPTELRLCDSCVTALTEGVRV